MSVQAMAWAYRQKTGSPTRKAVLVALADRMNQDTGRCDPSLRRIADDTELSTATVKRALVRLEEDGFVVRVRRKRDDGSDRATHYEFPPDDVNVTPVAHSEPGEGRRVSQGGRRRVSHEPEQTSNQKVEPKASEPYDPIVGTRVKVDGHARPQDLGWNALKEVTQAYGEANGPRLRAALATIREVTWGWIQERWPDSLAQVQADPEGYERRLAETIVWVARRLAERSPELTWGPEGIARNFARVLREDHPGSTAGIVDEVLRERQQ